MNEVKRFLYEQPIYILFTVYGLKMKKFILALILGICFIIVDDAKAALAPGVYPAYHGNNGACSNPCCMIPANNCIIIVVSTQHVEEDGSFGSVGPVYTSTDTNWQYEAITSDGSTIRFNDTE